MMGIEEAMNLLSLNQVARQLDLPPGVIRRLSAYCKIPKAYYHDIPNHPRLYSYTPREAQLLHQLKILIEEGASLEEARDTLRKKAPVVSNQAPFKRLAHDVAQHNPILASVEVFKTDEEALDLLFRKQPPNKEPMTSPLTPDSELPSPQGGWALSPGIKSRLSALKPTSDASSMPG